MDERAFFDGLNPAQRAAVASDAAPLCILAGAGSGKTRVLTGRIAHRVTSGSADARHVLALTFTRKAAGQLGGRLRALGVREQVVTGTFHAVAYAQLRRRWADRGEREPALLERKTRLLAPLLRGGRDATVQPADLAAEIEWAKARMVTPDRYEAEAGAAGRRPPLPAPVVATLYERYEADKRRRGLVDFDDLLMRCVRALETDPEFAAAQRWRFRHLFVDEFQDVNPVQFRLLEGWRGGRDDLCVVGDPNQAIYAWNGADASYLTEFRTLFPGAAVVRLDDNYRSSPQVLAVANAVLGTAPRHTRPLRANRPDGPLPTIRSFPSDVEEARAVARAIHDGHAPGQPWSRVAVLTRTNAQSVLFEEAFRRAGIPYRVRGGGAFLDQPEVRQVLAELRRTAARAPFASLLDDLESMARAAGDGQPGADTDTDTDTDTGADTGAGAGRGRAERQLELEALVRLGREYAAADPSASVEGFLAWLAATVRADEPERGGDAVELATFHRAKGLEWPVVFLAGLERGFVPIGHADTPAATAEERRLLYVAVTRAELELHCSWAEKRTFGSRTLTRTASPWLDTVQAACAALASGDPSADWRRFLADGRSRLASARGRGAGPGGRRGGAQIGTRADPVVFAALKEWRAGAARAAGVPAFVIFHDSTLAAVAEARPRNRDALLALPGFGPVKADRYGEALLAVVARHAASA